MVYQGEVKKLVKLKSNTCTSLHVFRTTDHLGMLFCEVTIQVFYFTMVLFGFSLLINSSSFYIQDMSPSAKHIYCKYFLIHRFPFLSQCCLLKDRGS